ncbi:MAG: NADH:flavin oxidoreductase, partial [Gemmiger formicilis]
MYETINSPINYGGLELKNRIIFAPTTFGLAEDEYFEKIRKIAAGGCAMIIIGDVPVGKSQFEKSLFDKKGFAFYRKLTELIHNYNCRVCAQLHQSDSNMLAMLKYV